MPNTITVSNNICLSTNIDMISEITRGLGPISVKIMLGCASWSAGQLEQELRKSMWFHFPASEDIIFTTDHELIWEQSFAKMGINAASLSPQAGTA